MKTTCLLLTLLSFLICTIQASAQINIERLLTESLENPIGLDVREPRFSWVLTSERRNTMQTAYEIRVAESERDLKRGRNLRWESGKVDSDASVFVPYQGAPLASGKKYFWQVRAWDNHGKSTGWSEPASFQMALLNPEEEFTARWISSAEDDDSEERRSPYFRKDFSLPGGKSIQSATAYVTARGMYEAHLNGQRIGDAYLTPGWTSYQDRLQYQTYDVTDMLNAGENAVGVALGSGWHRGYIGFSDQKNMYGTDVALLFQLDITYEDGSTESIVSDDSWKLAYGPVRNSEIYNGETYDAREEMPGWAAPGFDDQPWQAATERDFGKETLIATYNEPIRKQEVFQPQDIFTTPAGELVVDFGQNLVGWVELSVEGEAGDAITLYHAEVLDKAGNFYTENLRAAKQKNTYILKGEGTETFEPHFTFQGFRYVKVEGFPGELKPENLKAIALYSDMKPTGSFATSNELLNQLQHNIQWGQKGNFLDIPTDCPQRDERLGWTGDAQVFFRTAAYNMDVHNFFTKWMKDLAADQREDGAVPFVIPNVLGKSAAGSAGWADAATIIPWNMYLLYGDKRILEEQYSSMQAWVEYMHNQSEDYLWNKGFHFGDWLFYSPDDDRDGRAAITDKYLIAQSFFAHSTQLLINTARVLGKTDDVARYEELLENVKAAYRREYMTPAGRLVSSTQTAYVLALNFDLLPENLRAQAAERLVENVESYDYHLTTGFLGTPYLCHVLSRFGYEDVAYRLLMQETYPSWLYPVKMGATTIWERWDGIKPDSTFQTPSMNSYNHYAYGAIGEWMYENVAGIQASEEGPGYKQIVIKPVVGGDLTEGSGELLTYYGRLASSWKSSESSFEQHVILPVNTRADIYIPAQNIADVTEGGEPLDEVSDLEIVGLDEGYLHLRAGSGTYAFSVRKSISLR
jgi:alpha-L-rhamnosidase